MEATGIFEKNIYECFDAEVLELVHRGHQSHVLSRMHLSITSLMNPRQSTLIRPKVIISLPVLCDAGRIKHHLKHNLWREELYDSVCGAISRWSTLGQDDMEGLGGEAFRGNCGCAGPGSWRSGG